MNIFHIADYKEAAEIFCAVFWWVIAARSGWYLAGLWFSMLRGTWSFFMDRASIN